MAEREAKRRTPRYPLIDMVRGVAILGVIAFHISWDLRYYEFVLWPIDTNLGWIVFQKSLLGAFVGLAGASLWLGHGDGIRWPAFWRRLGILAGTALLVSIATWLLYPEAFVYFGVLHALALFSLLGLLFLPLPVWALAVIGVAIIGLGAGFQDPLFNARIYSWLGFWTVPPLTNDLVPIFPWFGVSLLGMAAIRLLVPPGPRSLLLRVKGQSRVGRALQLCGRWSLAIYLVHQPLVLAIIIPLAGIMQPSLPARTTSFLQSCEANCSIGSGEAGFCQRYCSCSFDQVQTGNLWEALAANPPNAEQSRQISSVTQLCSAMARSDNSQ